MNAVKIADLKNNLSRHLAHVREGGELTVLDRDTPIARIVPFAPRPARSGKAGNAAATERTESKQRIEELQRLGIIGAGDPGGLAAAVRERQPVKLPKGSPSAADLLVRMRRESTR